MTTNVRNTVSFTCESEDEARLLRVATAAYRCELIRQGKDPRTYAPANEDGAGFGWDTVQSASRDMNTGSVTHMSRRIAEGLRTAVEHIARITVYDSVREIANRVTARIDAAL